MLTTSYARVEITLITVAGTAATALGVYFFEYWGIVPAVLALALLAFYRNPRRRPPAGNNLIFAPADGKIVEISREVSDPEGAGPSLRIMIFLSVLDVHVNRSPCAGRVTAVEYRPGKFLSALKPEADKVNESNTLTIAPTAPLPGPVRVRQIAGVLARRIVCAVQPGAVLAAGTPLGMIKLGSRTEVRLPENPDWEVCVRLGDHVRAGATILARLRTDGAAIATVSDDPEFGHAPN
jgi:phosphatidylserine decarboxylase